MSKIFEFSNYLENDYIYIMEKFGNIELVISGKKGVIDLNPENYDIREIISDFKNVENLLFPDNKRNRPTISYKIEEGSVKHIFKTSIQYIIGFSSLLGSISSSQSIYHLDTNTAKAIESFQETAIKKNLTFNIRTSMPNSPDLQIDRTTNFYSTKPKWVDAEFYFYGKIIDAGGKDKINIHLLTSEVGTIIIKTSEQILSELEKNILYKEYGIRVTGKQNIENGEIDKSRMKFLELIDYSSQHEEKYLKGLRKKAMNWLQDINPDDWLDELRGRHYA